VSAIATTNQLLVHNEERPGAEVRLFCFPYAGSSAQLFLRWNDYVPEWIQVSGFEMPAHGRRLCESKAIGDQTEAATSLDTASGLRWPTKHREYCKAAEPRNRFIFSAPAPAHRIWDFLSQTSMR
jgi:hypothetical protein